MKPEMSRAAMGKALDALLIASSYLDGYYTPGGHCTLPEIEEAQAMLKAALAQSEAQPVALKFPVALRKMWSGGEVQRWLDEHTPQPEPWIAVSDRLPADEQVVVVGWPTRVHHFWQTLCQNWALARLSNGGFIDYINGAGWGDDAPTHWMPIPALPDKEGA
jgi:hypothetical protein